MSQPPAEAILLSVIRRLRPPTRPSFRHRETGAGPLGDEFTLHLRKTCHHMKEETPRHGLRVNAVGEAFEVDLPPCNCGTDPRAPRNL